MMAPFLKYGGKASLFLALTFAGISCQKAGSPPSPPAAPSPEVQALHEDRIATFQELVALAEASFEAATVPSTNVLEAKRNLLNAQLEAATASADRIALRESILENLKRFEAQVKGQVENGAAPVSNLLEVQAARIQAEIELAQERN